MPAKGKRKYDLAMIRDFLDHLKWELRISVFEATHPIGATNPELVEQLAKYMERYDVIGLLPFASAENLSTESVEPIRHYVAKESQKYLDHLDALDACLKMAFQCAQCDEDGYPVQIFKQGDLDE